MGRRCLGTRSGQQPSRSPVRIRRTGHPYLQRAAWGSLVFFGWGMGQAAGSVYLMGGDWVPARQALLDAGVTVFSLDITDADHHTLEVGLQAAAAETGGFYAKTHDFTAAAMARVEGALEGHYVLALMKPEGPRGAHRVRIETPGRGARVMAKPGYAD